MKPLNRRTILRGLAGIGVALPALEAMRPRAARAQSPAIPKRFVMSYAGISMGTVYAQAQPAAFPSGTGSGYPITRPLQSIADLGVQDDMSIVTGLEIPWVPYGQAAPPGGIAATQFHGNSVTPQIAGTHTTLSEVKGGGIYTPTAPTADQLVADAIAGSTQRLLAYRVQAHSYFDYNGPLGPEFAMSFARLPNGSMQAVDPISSPRVAYEALFSGFSVDPTQAARAAFLLRQRKSVLDFVMSDMQTLLPKLGAADRQVLDQHFTSIRGLESRLEVVDPSTCKVPSNPGADPPIGAALYDSSGNPLGNYTTAGYSNEDLRADLFTDFIAAAFACDITRVATLMQTSWKCYMNSYAFSSIQTDVHGLTHSDAINGLSDAVSFFIKQLARLTSKLKALKEVDGSSLLDHSAMVLLFEGGYGKSQEDGGQYDSTHSVQNMVAVLAGRAGGLKSGIHVDGAGRHPAKAVIAAMQSVGGPSTLGEVSGALPELVS